MGHILVLAWRCGLDSLVRELTQTRPEGADVMRHCASRTHQRGTACPFRASDYFRRKFMTSSLTWTSALRVFPRLYTVPPMLDNGLRRRMCFLSLPPGRVSYTSL
jgi:hypothetical protein